MMLSTPAQRMSALCLLVLGYVGDAYAMAVSMNSNAIKTLASSGKGADLVSPSPHTSPSHKLALDILQQPGLCREDEDCGGDEFCNDARGVCLPCRKCRKRCVRDSMCCAGNRCINGVCQANDIHSSDFWHRNGTAEYQVKKTHGFQPNDVKGQEGDTCLRSSDCSEGLCCARHFWSRICKPVLTEGQVCTRHRRKANHGLELFQRCDCGEGLLCRAERGEREQGDSRIAARNLHTCQRR